MLHSYDGFLQNCDSGPRINSKGKAVGRSTDQTAPRFFAPHSRQSPRCPHHPGYFLTPHSCLLVLPGSTKTTPVKSPWPLDCPVQRAWTFFLDLPETVDPSVTSLPCTLTPSDSGDTAPAWFPPFVLLSPLCAVSPRQSPLLIRL